MALINRYIQCCVNSRAYYITSVLTRNMHERQTTTFFGRYLSVFFIHQSQVFVTCYLLDLSMTYISSIFFSHIND